MTSYIKAAYDWVKSFKLSLITSIDNLKVLTIRQLKAVALKMNNELGQVICKASFGKTMSAMCKQELTNAIWFIRSVQMSAPKGKFDLRQLTQRIFTMLCDGEAHVYYFGFKKDANGTAEQNANRFQKHLGIKRLCCLSSVRKADRLKSYGFQFEVKVWSIDDNALSKLLTKDQSIEALNIAVEDRLIVANNRDVQSMLANKEIKGYEEINIEQWIGICQKMYDACPVGKAKVAMVKFAERKGLEVVRGKVEVKF